MVPYIREPGKRWRARPGSNPEQEDKSMPQATRKTTTVCLSQIARSPILQAFFARGERDTGETFAVPTTPTKPLNGQEAREVAYA